jgi:hypothetical protein
VAQKEKKRKISGPGVPLDFAMFLDLAVCAFLNCRSFAMAQFISRL